MLSSIDVSSLNLSLPKRDPTLFQLSWQGVVMPTGYSMLEYTYDIKVTDEQGRLLQDPINTPNTNYTYKSVRSRFEFPECSKLTFSLEALYNSSIRSRSVNVSWNNAESEPVTD